MVLHSLLPVVLVANFYSAQTGSAGNFYVNGILTASGIADTGSLSTGTLAVSGATTLGGALTSTARAALTSPIPSSKADSNFCTCFK